MGFFTTNWGLANDYNNPTVGDTNPFMPGAGSLSSTQNINPFQWTPQPSGQRQTNWGAPNSSAGTGDSYNFAGTVGSQNPFGNMFGGYGGFNQQQQPWWMNQQQQQQPQITQSQQRGMSPRPQQATDGDDWGDNTSATPADRTPQGYQDYFNYGRKTLTGIGALLGPLGSALPMAGDYNMGFNTFSPNTSENLGFANPLTGNYTSFYNDNYAGPGSEDSFYNNMSVPSEQRDMMINQIGYDVQPDSIRGEGGFLGGFFGGMLGGNTMNYDRDLDMSLGPWQQTTSIPLDTYNRNNPNYWTGTVPSALTQTQQNVLDGEKSMNQMQAQVDAAKAAKAAAASSPWSNPYANTDLSSLGASLGTGPATTYTSSNDRDGYDGSVSVTSDTGNTTSYDTTDYGGGSYGVDVGGVEDVGWEDPDSGGDSGGGSGGGGGGSYIATAATQALGEEGLKTFEDWRDYMHSWHPTFTASFGRYRVTAPKIVEEINKSDNPKGIYNYIWDMHLKPIFDLISEDKDSKKALKDYKIMVRELSNKFLRKEKA